MVLIHMILERLYKSLQKGLDIPKFDENIESFTQFLTKFLLPNRHKMLIGFSIFPLLRTSSKDLQ